MLFGLWFYDWAKGGNVNKELSNRKTNSRGEYKQMKRTILVLMAVIMCACIYAQRIGKTKFVETSFKTITRQK